MRRTPSATLVALVAVGGLTLGLAPAAAPALGASAGDGRLVVAAQTSADGSTSRERAAAALEHAKALFSGQLSGQASTNGSGGVAAEPVDASIVMRDLFSVLDDLSAADRRVARAILARPTDGPRDPFNDGYTVPSLKKCQGNICLHWVRSTEDAPASKTWVNQMLRLMNKVWKKEVRRLGYRPPVSDRGRGGSNKFDVYLAQIGDEGFYGYCSPERKKPGFDWVADGYCVLDNDMAEFTAYNAPIDSARVTAAHEFFHAIQFGYDYGEDVWLLEATATWMEERIFDDVNDNRQYLGSSQLASSLTPLDFYTSGETQAYGNWTFFEFLSQSYGKGVVKKILTAAAAFHRTDLYSTRAISKILKPKGGFAKVYSRFVSANLLPAKFYPEGQAWPSTELGNTFTLTRSDRRTGKRGSRLLHMSSLSYQVRSSSSLASKKWRLKVKIDGPAKYRMPAASVVVLKRKGTERYFVRLNSKGNGQVVVPFGRKQVKSVYVSLVNASTRFKCGRKFPFSCSGLPIDDGRSFRGQSYKFSATVIKRR